jgi:hypothetical protein
MTSLVEQAVEQMIGLDEGGRKHKLVQGLDYEKTPSSSRCELQSGNETSFVALFADMIAQTPCVKEEGLSYHQLFYFPSRDAEHSVGYDLSIGKYSSRSRIRTMHKELKDIWCDEAWKWRLPSTDRKISLVSNRSRRNFNYELEGREPSGDYRHLIALLTDYHNTACSRLFPYLVLHVNYCIHDYRRMGMTVRDGQGALGTWEIPGPESLLRTVVVDLSKIRETLGDGWLEKVQTPQFLLKVEKKSQDRRDGEQPGQFLERIADHNLVEVTVETRGEQPRIVPNCVMTVFDLATRVGAILRR